MYGKSIKCDRCDRHDFINDYGNDRATFFDAGFDGWIRLTVNKPRDYGWTFRDPKFATVVDSVDLCSISCAQDYLRDVRNTVPSDDVAGQDA